MEPVVSWLAAHGPAIIVAAHCSDLAPGGCPRPWRAQWLRAQRQGAAAADSIGGRMPASAAIRAQAPMAALPPATQRFTVEGELTAYERPWDACVLSVSPPAHDGTDDGTRGDSLLAGLLGGGAGFTGGGVSRLYELRAEQILPVGRHRYALRTRIQTPWETTSLPSTAQSAAVPPRVRVLRLFSPDVFAADLPWLYFGCLLGEQAVAGMPAPRARFVPISSCVGTAPTTATAANERMALVLD